MPNRRAAWLFAACLLFSSFATHAAYAADTELTVSAAASLTNAFREVGQRYEAQHPGVKVLFNFAASGSLLQQIARGAPVDVFATADMETMDQAQTRALLATGSRQNFARNSLVVILPQDSKWAPAALADLNDARLTRMAIGNPASVPVGRYARRALEAAQVWPLLESRMVYALNVRQALDYVARGEVDAGIVYASDALVMKARVRTAFDVPLPANVAIRYPIAAVGASRNGEEARRFIDYVCSAAGQTILARHGFLSP